MYFKNRLRHTIIILMVCSSESTVSELILPPPPSSHAWITGDVLIMMVDWMTFLLIYEESSTYILVIDDWHNVQLWSLLVDVNCVYFIIKHWIANADFDERFCRKHPFYYYEQTSCRTLMIMISAKWKMEHMNKYNKAKYTFLVSSVCIPKRHNNSSLSHI